MSKQERVPASQPRAVRPGQLGKRGGGDTAGERQDSGGHAGRGQPMNRARGVRPVQVSLCKLVRVLPGPPCAHMCVSCPAVVTVWSRVQSHVPL